MTTFAQVFCSLAELEQGLKSQGAEREGFYLPKIKAVSQTMLMDFGDVLPVTRVRKFNGRSKEKLFIPALLEITSVVNDGTTLQTTDYVKQPDQGHWPNGPYSMLEKAYQAANLSSWVEKEEGVVITGRWGLFSLLSALGITVGDNQTDVATILQVNNGAVASPGMIIHIESEDQYIESTSSTPVTGVTTITEAITDAVSQQVTFANAALVNIGEIIRIGTERMKILEKNDTTHQGTVVRGWDQSIAAAHADNAAVDVYRKFNVVRAVNGTTAAAHASSTAIYRQDVPADIKELCVEMSARYVKNGDGGYQGVVGDPNTGTSKYLYTKPFNYDEILEKYRIHRAG